MLTKEEMQEALGELDATILIEGGELRLSNTVHVERLATFDFDFEGATLVQVWDHRRVDQYNVEWQFALVSWDIEVIHVWTEHGLWRNGSPIEEAAKLTLEWLGTVVGNRRANRMQDFTDEYDAAVWFAQARKNTNERLLQEARTRCGQLRAARDDIDAELAEATRRLEEARATPTR